MKRTSIDLTPDFDRLFEVFSRDAVNQAGAVPALVRGQKYEDAVTRLRGTIVALSVAIQSAHNLDMMVKLRETASQVIEAMNKYEEAR